METTDKKDLEKNDSLSRSILGQLSSLTDSDVLDGEQKSSVSDSTGDTETIVRDVVDTQGGNTIVRDVVDTQDEFIDEIVISCPDDIPSIGDEVTVNGVAVEDGEYTFGEDDTSVYVEDGVITAIGDEEVSDLVKKVVIGGRVVKKKVRMKKKRMSSKQKAGLKKAQRKAHSPSAKKARAKSMKVRSRKIAASEENPTSGQVDGVNFEELGDALLLAALTYLKDELNLKDEQIDFLDEVLPDEAFTAEISDDLVKIQIPIWTEINDEVELADFELQTYELELEGEFDNESLVEQLTDGGDSILGQLII